MKREIDKKAYIDAAKTFLEGDGYDVREFKDGAPFDIFFKDGDCSVFCDVVAGDGELPSAPKTRKQFEQAIFGMDLGENCLMRYDCIAIQRVAERKAVLRHHKNALGSSTEEMRALLDGFAEENGLSEQERLLLERFAEFLDDRAD